MNASETQMLFARSKRVSGSTGERNHASRHGEGGPRSSGDGVSRVHDVVFFMAVSSKILIVQKQLCTPGHIMLTLRFDVNSRVVHMFLHSLFSA